MSTVTLAPARGVLSVVRDYVSLLKLRIVLLLDATAVGVMIPAANGQPRLTAVIAVFAGGTLAAGGAHVEVPLSELEHGDHAAKQLLW